MAKSFPIYEMEKDGDCTTISRLKQDGHFVRLTVSKHQGHRFFEIEVGREMRWMVEDAPPSTRAAERAFDRALAKFSQVIADTKSKSDKNARRA